MRCAKPRETRRNLMPPILDAVRAYATVGEMCDTLRDVWGEYEEVGGHLRHAAKMSES